MKERREYQRLEFDQSFTLESGGRSGKNVSTAGKRRRATAENVSEGGLCLLTRSSVKTDQIYKLRLPLRGVPIHLPTLVMVRWVETRDGLYRAGVMFVL